MRNNRHSEYDPNLSSSSGESDSDEEENELGHLKTKKSYPSISAIPRPATPPRTAPPSSQLRNSHSTLSFGVVCSSNINRSMEAHLVLTNAGLRVESYGTGSQVKLPGKSSMEPRVFKFGTPYSTMFDTLSREDYDFFCSNGVIQLCQRGAAVKASPTRWQDTPSSMVTKHDVIIAFEERIFDAVVEDLQTREVTETFEPLHVICLDTKDNPTEAARQGRVALELCWEIEECGKKGELEENLPLILEQFEATKMSESLIKILYQVCYL